MQKIRKRFLLLLFFLLFIIFAGNILYSKVFNYPLPPSNISPVQNFIILDLTSVITGLRRLGADIAWVQLLQYYASPEKPLDKETEYKLSIDMTKYLFGYPVEKTICREEGCNVETHYHPPIEGGEYKDLLKYCLRIVNLDPFFFYVYLYGSGALAWNHNRTDEALELLQAGIKNMEKFKLNITSDLHQPYWQFNIYASAIIYRKKGEDIKMISLIETAAVQPEAPNLIKAILANIYQKSKKFDLALKFWTIIYDSKDPEYSVKAKEKIIELKKLLSEN
ncbi:MAG: hypothetical protein NT145_07300 [Elusimicrobia bacterium]|nr:hypothetical protein [Elusimicrobiota bacterium]